MNARRAHAKSRNGCIQCKTRKVKVRHNAHSSSGFHKKQRTDGSIYLKCDEEVPCSRCVKRGEKCSFTAIVTPSATSEASLATGSGGSDVSSSQPQQSLGQDDTLFTLADIRLFHHFSTVTCRYLANPNLTSPWLDYIPKLATKHTFLMQEMMAVAALDVSISVVSSDAEVTANLELARQHHAQGIAGLRAAISSHSAELVEAIWACNALLVPYYFGSTADVSSLLFREDSAEPAEWITAIRGAAMLYRQYEQVLLSGPMKVHIQPYQTRIRFGGVIPPKENPSGIHVENMTKRLQAYLESQAAATDTETGKLEVMAQVFKFLRDCFQISDRGDLLSKKTASLTFVAIMPQTFFEMMGRKDQVAMVIMAFWCVLLDRAEGANWWMQFRKVRNMLQFIADILEPEMRALIQWPLDELHISED